MSAAADAGDLRFRLLFEAQVPVANDAGGTTVKWVAQFTRWGDIRPMKGSEPVLAQRLTGVQPVLIVVRSDSQTRRIDTSWRAVELNGGRRVAHYGLKTAADMERTRDFITMVAEAGVADG